MSQIVSRKYLLPFILVASLFFCWGFAHSILDILNKHFFKLRSVSALKYYFAVLCQYNFFHL